MCFVDVDVTAANNCFEIAFAVGDFREHAVLSSLGIGLQYIPRAAARAVNWRLIFINTFLLAQLEVDFLQAYGRLL